MKRLLTMLGLAALLSLSCGAGHAQSPGAISTDANSPPAAVAAANTAYTLVA